MPVVVTGAAGFIGGMLTSALSADGEQVVAVDRRPLPVRPAGVTELRADLLDRDPAVDAALREADAVFHLAGWSGRSETESTADLRWYRDNVLTAALVLATVPAGTPLVVTSAASVYGGGDGPSREDDPVHPLSGHARSKVEVERLCARRFVAGGAVTVARPFTVAGEGQRPDMAIAGWIEAVRTGAPVTLVGSPWRTRDVTDVRDVVRSLRAMAERGVVGLLNIGTGAPRTLADLVTAVCRAVGAPPELALLPDRADEPAATQAD
ncbi:MAG TPA: NAD(P)-dependent oxidoreductase, partial [Mycobacteriales bacterium]|nr:NAD(P)-dependent oxidoreductase [Mycobacteriales bacterium]